MPPTPPFPLQVFDVFSAEECVQIDRRIKELRDSWIERPNGMYTLGTAAYLDVPDAKTVAQFGVQSDERLYFQRVSELNPLLRENFGWMYDRLASSLSHELNAECRYYPDFSLPGFHVFPEAAHFASQTSHIPHFDRQFTALPWKSGEEIDFRQSLSITLSVRLPAAGGGLKLWDADYYEVTAMPKEQAKEYIRTKQSTFHPYKVGSWICHTGNELHQIAPWTAQPGDERITLQGHGLWFDGRWNLYW